MSKTRGIMGLTCRTYIFAESGQMKRVPRRISDGLTFGHDGIPEFAGTKQRIAEALIENEGQKPVRILDVRGSYWEFDDTGRVDVSLSASLSEWMDAFGFGSPATRETGRVVSLVPEIKKRDFNARHRWDVTRDDVDRIAADIWPGINGAAEDIATVKGVKPKRPPLTYEARKALNEIGPLLLSVTHKLEDLSENGLKGLAFEARRTATNDENPELWNALAIVCERLRELRTRQRTGKGIWYAVLEASHWDDPTQRSARCFVLAHEKCDGKNAAVEAARQLLRTHAERFDAETTIDVSVRSELEWRPDEGDA